LLVLADKLHLQEVNSPLASAVPDRVEDYGSVDFFYDEVLPATGHSAETGGIWPPLAELLHQAA
jgi:hypothetical protein